MFRILSITITMAAIISMSGCVLGPGGGGGHCNSCDGYGDGGYVGTGPGDAFRQWRRGLTCGSGCGETYYDEWYSSPPDCEDPCPQFAGCGTCGGGCGFDGGCLNQGCGGSACGRGIQPLRTIAGLAVGLYGKRFCGDCGYNYDDCSCGGGCGCGDGGCDGGCGGDFYGGGEVIGGPMIQGGGGGCATGSCSINRGGGQSRMARSNVRTSPAYQQAMARQQAAKVATNQPARSSNSQVVYPDQPNQPNQKFYRQATRLPQGQPAFRR